MNTKDIKENKFKIGQVVKLRPVKVAGRNNIDKYEDITKQTMLKRKFIVRAIYYRNSTLAYLLENIKTGCKEEIEERYLEVVEC